MLALKRFFQLMFLLTLAFPNLAFRLLPGAARWDISPQNPTIWVRFSYRPSIGTNDLASDDPLAGATLTFTTATQSILDDYNNVGTSFLRLRDIQNNPPTGSENATGRTIDITFVDTQFAVAGLTRRHLEGTVVTGCNIDISNKALSSAKTFLYTLTHELGHCAGLDHPQESTNAIMSYFSDRSRVRLLMDDKMGLTYVYPVDPDMARETPTFGFSCSPR